MNFTRSYVHIKVLKVLIVSALASFLHDLLRTASSRHFDATNIIIMLRFIDPLWCLKRCSHIGLEALLAQSIKLMAEFTYIVIHRRKAEIIEVWPAANRIR
jgi:hypothetical protein